MRTRRRIPKRTLSLAAAAGIGLLSARGAALAQQPLPEGITAPRAESERGRYVPGEILVKLRDARVASGLATPGSGRARGLASVLDRYGLSTGRRPFPRGRSPRARGLDRIVKLASPDLARPGRMREALAALRQRPEVEYAEPIAILEAQWQPNDPYLGTANAWGQAFGDLWGLHAIHAPDAWDTSLGAGVTVAVIDTGIDGGHPEIAGNVWQNPGELGVDALGADKHSNGIDDDGNGFVDDWWGWDFYSADNEPFDDHGHGTHVAGTIAAVADNGVGIAGVAPLARVMAVKGLGAGGSGTSEQIAEAILYAADNGASVINLSLGALGETPRVLEDAIAYAHDVRGVVVVAAAGNYNMNVGSAAEGFFPANIRDVIAVAAFDHDDLKASFSNHGAKIDLAAPGGGGTEPAGIYDPHRSVLSLLSAGAGSLITGSGQLVVDGSYLRQAGTSMAAPHVAGVAALVRSLRPGLSPEQVRQALRASAEDLGAAGFDVQTGYGRVDAGRALDDDSPLAALLTGPIGSFPVVAAPEVHGTASGPGLVDWTLEYGAGPTPVSWTAITSSGTPVDDGVLTAWDALGLADGDYALRLSARDDGGRVYEDRMVVTIDSVSITSPSPDEKLVSRAGDAIAIQGTATPSSFDAYSFVITGERTGPLADPQVALVNGGLSPVVDGLLGTWDTSSVPADHYEVCLRVDLVPVGYRQECIDMIVDPALHPGWPVDLGQIGNGFASWSLVDHLIAEDLNGDGAAELLVAYGSDVRAFDHTGAALPGWPRTIDPDGDGAMIQFGPAVGDVTGDGLPDVVALNNRGQVFVWHGDGRPVAGWPRALFVSYGSVAVADLDADGKAEILAAGGNATLAVDGNGEPLPGWPRNGGATAVGDVNGDGEKEVVIASKFSPGRIYVYEADGSVLPGWPREVNPTMPTGYFHDVHPALADLDGDGADEIVANARDGTVHVFRGDGSTLPGWPRLTQGTRANPPAVGDVDGDGEPDVVVGVDRVIDGVNKNYLYAWHADGTPLPGWPVLYADRISMTYFGFGAPALVDLDGDGAAEVIASSDANYETSFALHAYRSDGTEWSDFPRPTRRTGSYNVNSAAVADLDADGLLELAWIDGDLALYVWDLPTTATAAQPWPMFRRDPGHGARLLSHRLSVVVRGAGQVAVDPPGEVCGGTPVARCEYDPAPGTTVSLTALPDPGALPTDWGGACPEGVPTCEVAITSYHQVVVTMPPNAAPVANAGGPYDGAPGLAIAFDGTASSDADGDALTYSWDFGDDTSATGPTVTHAYASSDVYTATLVVHDGHVASAPDTVTVTVANQPPVADAGGPYAGVRGQLIAFDGTASSDADGHLLTYAWDFGDGTTATGPAPAHTYTAPDVYTVSLVVHDGYAASAPATATVTVANQPPVADAGGPYAGLPGQAIVLDGTASSDADGDALTWSWDFGDGTTGSGSTATHTYAAPDVYTVTLVVHDGYTASAPDTAAVTVTNQPPVADAGGPYAGLRFQTIVFDGTASSDADGQALTYAWDFGDGGSATGPAPAHAYAAPGAYTVTLVVHDGYAASPPATASVTIANQAPVPFAGGPYTGTDTAPVAFDASASLDADGDPLSYGWDFGDGSTGSGPTPSHQYALGGTYAVTLSVSDGYDSVSTETSAAITDTTAPAPVADLSAVPLGRMTARLTWTATGDSGDLGTAALYDVRYSPEPITEASFATATPVPNEPAPQRAGTAEILDVSGLLPGSVYYFALRVADQAGHVSALSNVAAVTTSGALLFLDDAESGPGQWTVVGTDGVGGPSLWHVAGHRYASPTQAFYYGLDATTTYDTGARNYGTLTSPPIDLGAATGSYLSFQYFLQKEGSSYYDRAQVLLSADGGVTWTTIAELAARAAMAPSQIELAAWDGQTVRIRFSFDTIDRIANSYEGWVLDDVIVAAASHNRRPVADPGGPYVASVGAPAVFDGSASADPDGGDLTYAWDFGDGSTGTGATPTHTYSTSGVFPVRLVVNDGSLDSLAATTAAAVDNRAPAADAGGPYDGLRGQTLGFDGSGSSDPDGDALSYSWDFGDGGWATGSTPNHVYTAAGSYTVSLVVSDGVETASGTASVTIADPVEVALVSPGSGPVAGGTVVTIQGSGFGTTQGAGAVRFGGMPALSYLQWSPGQIVCVAPAHAEGVVDVQVTTDWGRTGTAPAAFVYVAPAALPWVESFDHGGALPADWQQVPSDDFDWAVDAAGTSSSGTGPSVDHTLGSAAGYYVYTEASYPNYPSKLAELVSPLLSTAGATSLTLRFWYHMYGSTMGSLHVDVSSDGVWYEDVVPALAGDQGNEWREQVVNLSPWAGSSIRVRFRGVTGSSYTGDMAIDDVSLTDGVPPPTIAAVSPQTGPVGGGTAVTIDGSRFGATRGAGSVTFGGVAATSCPTWSDTRIVCATPSHAAGPADVTVTTDTGGVDTASGAFTYAGSVSTFPYAEDFEAGGALPADWTQDTDDDFDWLPDAGGTPSVGTGPTADHTLGSASGYYVYTESSSPNYPSKRAALVSPFFDTAGLVQPTLTFWSHMYGAAMGTLHVDLEQDGVWLEDVMPPIAGDQGNVWQQHTLDLAAYSGVFRIRFRVVTGTSYTSDVAIDDIAIAEP